MDPGQAGQRPPYLHGQFELTKYATYLYWPGWFLQTTGGLARRASYKIRLLIPAGHAKVEVQQGLSCEGEKYRQLAISLLAGDESVPRVIGPWAAIPSKNRVKTLARLVPHQPSANTAAFMARCRSNPLEVGLVQQGVQHAPG
jgi:hypothetical protein